MSTRCEAAAKVLAKSRNDLARAAEVFAAAKIAVQNAETEYAAAQDEYLAELQSPPNSKAVEAKPAEVEQNG